MKETQNNPAYTVDDFEDLTRFANESFDTGEIDLFAFAGNEEQSPLTRLKSIILSLDWEITDETLQELADELKNLADEWKGDKVAQVYLQGLSKIGAYIQDRGAYAHHNAIKLLLTFFYDFEKIVVSENLSQDEATRILKGDVRKFRILQYQIAQHEAAAAEAEGKRSEWSQGYGLPEEENVITRQLKIAVLAIDWEVTRETIGALRDALAKLKQTIPENGYAMVLIQGLNGLCEYVAEEKANAYPESFTLLHSFCNALEKVADPARSKMDEQAIKSLVQDRVARLLELKMLLAGHPLEEQPVVDRPTPLEDKVAAISDTDLPSGLEARSAEEKERTLTPEEKEKTLEDLEMEIDSFFEMDGKSSSAVTDDDDEDDDILPRSSSGEVVPALAGMDAPASSLGQFESADGSGQLLDGLTSGIDDFFNAKKEDDNTLSEDFALSFDPDDTSGSLLGSDVQMPAMESKDSRYPDEVLSPDAIHPVDDVLADDFIESSLSSKRGLKPALSGIVEHSGFHEEDASVDLEMQSDLAEQLDTLFADAEGDEETAEAEEESLFLTLDLESEEGPTFPGAENITPFEEEDPDLLAINTKLDDFFALGDDEEGVGDEAQVEAALSSVTEDAPAFSAEPEPAFAAEPESAFAAEPEPTFAAEPESTFAAELPSEKQKAETSLEEDLAERLDLLFDDDTLAEQASEEEQEAAMEEVKAVEEELAALEEEEQKTMEAQALVVEEPAPVAVFSSPDPGSPGAEVETTAGETSVPHFFDQDELQGEDKAASEESAVPHFFAQDNQQMQLDTVGALLPGLVQLPTPTKVDALAQAMQGLREKGLSPDQQALLHLLNATVAMLTRLPVKDRSSTGLLVNHLYEALSVKEGQAETLASAVGSFAAWIEESCQFMSMVPSMQEALQQSLTKESKQAATGIYQEVSSLRDFVREEFDKLRHELRQHSH